MHCKKTKKIIAVVLTLTLILATFPVSNGNVQAIDVNVSKTQNYNQADWKSVIFGQTTDTGYNSITTDNTNNTVTATAGTKDGTHTGGKITNSHDGISYYYTEVDPSKNFVLSADVKVNYFAKSKPDNQEGFGIMARDAIGTNGNADAFPSNMVMVGGYSGSIQSVFRNNVKDSTGAGATMEGVTKFANRPVNNGTVTYRLVMKKTNTGYIVSVNNGAEKVYYRPKQLEVLDSKHIYVGFFAARVASITVSNINFTTSNVSTDPAGQPDPSNQPQLITPSIGITSAVNTGDSNYNLNLKANASGSVEVKQNGSEIYSGLLDSNNMLMKNTTLALGNNVFDVVYTPSKSENVASLNPVKGQYTVTLKNYGLQGDAIYVSPTGTASNKGTLDNPTDIYTAIKYIASGQKIYLRGGTYKLNAPITISNSGTYKNPNLLAGYKDERPVLDFNQYNGFNLAGDYWNVKGIDVTNACSTGFRVSGNHNVINQVNTYKNGDTGLQVSGSANDKINKWPSYNLILNCTSHDNVDPSQNNADGFAAKLTCGVGNVFRGCISHNNCDDGYDLYSKLETGPIGAVTIENCIAYRNGTLSDGTKTNGDGNGFKMGGEGLAVKHVLRNCLSFNNNSAGITSNSDPADIFENCTSVDNGSYNFDLLYFNSAVPNFIAKNDISYRTTKGIADSIPNANLSDDNYFYDGKYSKNKSGKILSALDFKSVVPPKTIGRNSNGSIAYTDFMIPSTNSQVKSAANLYDFSNITTVQGTPIIDDTMTVPTNNNVPTDNNNTPANSNNANGSVNTSTSETRNAASPSLLKNSEIASTTKLPKTGYFIDTQVLIVIGMIMSTLGILTLVIERYKKRNA